MRGGLRNPFWCPRNANLKVARYPSKLACASIEQALQRHIVMASKDQDKKRSQQSSKTKFETRGDRASDETSGIGKAQTSPCKRGPGLGAPAAPQELFDGGVDDAEPLISPLCRAWVSFVNKGVYDGPGLSFQDFMAMGETSFAVANEEAKRRTVTVDHDLLRVNFKNVGEDGRCHIRLGPSPREAFEAVGRCNPMFKGGGVLAHVDELFWLTETTKKATR